MPRGLRKQLLQKIEASQGGKSERHIFSELSDEDKKELMELINEPAEKNTVSHGEYLKATARWRTN